MITENDIRRKVVDTAIEYLLYNEMDGSHKQIIDIYNSHKPLARGYKVKYTDAWCATFVSAIAIRLGYTDIMPCECGCSQMIQRYIDLSQWEEDDAYVPQLADIVFYDWDDNGISECKGNPDHVGIVVEVIGDNIKVIEGNKTNAVDFRTITVNGKHIRGYGTPCYLKKINNKEKAEVYIVKAGDTLSEIAAKYGTTCETIAAMNNITNINLIHTGDHIYIPTVEKRNTYIVQRGDTLSEIASKFNIDIETLVTLNEIEDRDVIFEGQIIKLL